MQICAPRSLTTMNIIKLITTFGLASAFSNNEAIESVQANSIQPNCMEEIIDAAKGISLNENNSRDYHNSGYILLEDSVYDSTSELEAEWYDLMSRSVIQDIVRKYYGDGVAIIFTGSVDKWDKEHAANFRVVETKVDPNDLPMVDERSDQAIFDN